MRKFKFYLLSLFVTLSVFLIFSSCKKNLHDVPFYYSDSSIENGLSINEAKAWYEQRSSVSLRTTTENKSNFKIHSPIWSKAINSGDSNYYIVETPVQFDKSPGFIIKDSASSFQTAEANDAVKLLVLKNKKSGTIRFALMHVVSDTGIPDSTNTYTKRNTHFSGFIFFSNLDGSFINGWRYTDGKITSQSSSKPASKKMSKRINMSDAVSLMAPVEPGPVDCSTYTIVYEERYCVGDYCTPWTYVGEDSYTYCTGGGGGGTGGGGGGIQYTEYDEPTPEARNSNQDIIDSLKGYACAQDILKQLPSINNEVDSIIQKIFGVNEDVNLTFSIDNSLTKDSLDGYTKFPGGSASFFDSKIELNPWVLQNSTKEYILVTMLHEAIHSYIDYWYNQYLTKQIDSTTFKNRFPIFWNYKSVLKDPSEIAEHNAMANNYITTMKNAIKSYNSTATDAAADALAWGGLQGTTVWKAKSDTTNIINMNLNSRDVSLNKFSQYNFQKCGGMLVE